MKDNKGIILNFLIKQSPFLQTTIFTFIYVCEEGWKSSETIKSQLMGDVVHGMECLDRNDL